MRVKPVKLADGSDGLASDGAPSDCVALAILGVVPAPIDLVVSGINPNANIGHDVTYSGTVTAAMEAVIAGIPGIAVSLDAPEYCNEALDYATAASAACQVAGQVLKKGLPKRVLLNINVPYLIESELKGYCISRQGMRIYRDELVKRDDPRGRPYYWIGGDPPTGVNERGTDFGDLAAGYVSITPLQMDMTAQGFLDELSEWSW
jgi:5'-nucleotidase